jgi:hypothetical protein
MRSFLRDLDGRDPYEILQVPRNATTEEIIAAHRRLVRRLHPDSPTGDTDAAALLNVARDILSDPITRAEYDRFAAERAAGGAQTTASRTETTTSGARGPWYASDTGMPGATEQPWTWDTETTTSGTTTTTSGAQGPWYASDTGMPAGATEQPSAWDAEDVVAGAVHSPNVYWNAYWQADAPQPAEYPPPAYPQPGYTPPAYPRPGYVPPAYPPRYMRVPWRTGLGFGMTALFFSCAPALCVSWLCTPIGLILGIVGWVRYPRGSAGRICSIIAVVISGLILCLALLLSGLIPDDPSVPAGPTSSPASSTT